MNVIFDSCRVNLSPAFRQQAIRNVEHKLGIFATVIDVLAIHVTPAGDNRHYVCSMEVQTSNNKKYFVEAQDTSIRQLLDVMVRKMRKLMYQSFRVMRTGHRRRRFDQARAG